MFFPQSYFKKPHSVIRTHKSEDYQKFHYTIERKKQERERERGEEGEDEKARRKG